APPAPQARIPVWAFELTGVLLDVEEARKFKGATQNATQNASDTAIEPASAVVGAKQPFVRAAP
ncbi:MAG: hypothetical protein ACOVKR_07775, partial [Limnohabitans sp.]